MWKAPIIIAIAILLLRRLISGIIPYEQPKKKKGHKGKRTDNKLEIDPAEKTGEYSDEDDTEEDLE